MGIRVHVNTVENVIWEVKGIFSSLLSNRKGLQTAVTIQYVGNHAPESFTFEPKDRHYHYQCLYSRSGVLIYKERTTQRTTL